MPLLEGFLEKSAKYTKSWTKRYLVFDPETCKLSYGESQQKMKQTIQVTNIERSSQLSAKIVAGSPDLYSCTVEGKLPDGKDEKYSIRCPDAHSFDEWFFAIRHAVGKTGSMDPFDYGLPERDPRTNLAFVRVPVEHLYRFHLLDRAIMYFFREVNVYSSTGGDDSSRELLVIGDRCMYLFQATAEVHRCIPMQTVSAVWAGQGCIGIQFSPPQHDLLFVDCMYVAEMVEVITGVLKAIPSTEHIEVNTSISSVDGIHEKLHLTQRDSYTLKVIPPTAKSKLKTAMDAYEKQTGKAFVYGSAAKPAAKIDTRAVHRAPEAAAAMDMDDPLAALLMRLKLNQYIVLLQRQHVDMDLIACMEADDLKDFGIDDNHHCRLIWSAVKGEPMPESPAAGPAAASSSPPPQAGLGQPAAKAAPPQSMPPQATGAGGAAKPVVVLDDSEDDLPPPKRIAITLSSDDDDDDLGIVMPAKKPIVLEDSDDDLPGPIGLNASMATSMNPGPASPAHAARGPMDDDDI